MDAWAQELASLEILIAVNEIIRWTCKYESSKSIWQFFYRPGNHRISVRSITLHSESHKRFTISGKLNSVMLPSEIATDLWLWKRRSLRMCVLLLTGYISFIQSSTIFQWHFDDGVAWFTYCSVVKSLDSSDNLLKIRLLFLRFQFTEVVQVKKKVNYIMRCAVLSAIFDRHLEKKMWYDLLCIVTILSGNRLERVMNQTLCHCKHLTVESTCL